MRPRTAAHVLTRASLVLGSLLVGACGDDTSAGTGGGGGTSGEGGATTGSTSSPASVGSTTSSGATTSSSATTSSASGSGGAGGAGGAGGGEEFVPTPESIDFASLGALPAGEQILFNDWNAFPNTVASMPPSGGTATPVFEAFRVWSMGVSPDGNTIAFSSADPQQEAHYGTALGDAIQHTFLYDAVTEAAAALTWGNINDECHQFSADGARLYLCRRSNFRTQGNTFLNDGYHVGRVDLGTSALELITQPSEDEFVLSPQPDADESSLLVQWIDLPNTRSIRRIDLGSGDDVVLREDAGFPVLSPDGGSYLYSDYTDAGSLWSSSEEGGDEVLVVDRQASNARWSPDGTQVVYLLWDDAAVCSHVEVVAADGSEADAPTRIRDCAETGEFISDLAWITR